MSSAVRFLTVRNDQLVIGLTAATKEIERLASEIAERDETIRRLTEELEELTQATDALTSRIASIQPGTASGTGQKIIDGLNDAIAGRYDRVTVYNRNPARPRSPEERSVSKERSGEVTEEMLAAARAAFDEHARHIDMQDGLIDDPLGYALGAALEAALSPAPAGETKTVLAPLPMPPYRYQEPMTGSGSTYTSRPTPPASETEKT